MSPRRLLLILPIIIVVGVGLVAQGPWATRENSEYNGIRVELYVFRNGELVYHDPDDPAVENLGRIIAELVAPTQGWSIKASDGTLYNFIDTAEYADRDGIIIISDDIQSTFNRTMYAVPEGTQTYSATPSVSVTYDENGVYVTISASFTVSSPMNITWTGLYASWDTSLTSGGADKYFLLFADKIDPPVQVNPSDTITVVYKIVLP